MRCAGGLVENSPCRPSDIRQPPGALKSPLFGSGWRPKASPSPRRTSERIEPAEPRRITPGRCHISSLLLLPFGPSQAGLGRAGPQHLRRKKKKKMGLAFCAQGAASFRFSAASAPNDARTAAQSTNCCTTIQWWWGEGGWAWWNDCVSYISSSFGCRM